MDERTEFERVRNIYRKEPSAAEPQPKGAGGAAVGKESGRPPAAVPELVCEDSRHLCGPRPGRGGVCATPRRQSHWSNQRLGPLAAAGQSAVVVHALGDEGVPLEGRGALEGLRRTCDRGHRAHPALRGGAGCGYGAAVAVPAWRTHQQGVAHRGDPPARWRAGRAGGDPQCGRAVPGVVGARRPCHPAAAPGAAVAQMPALLLLPDPSAAGPAASAAANLVPLPAPCLPQRPGMALAADAGRGTRVRPAGQLLHRARGPCSGPKPCAKPSGTPAGTGCSIHWSNNAIPLTACFIASCRWITIGRRIRPNSPPM